MKLDSIISLSQPVLTIVLSLISAEALAKGYGGCLQNGVFESGNGHTREFSRAMSALDGNVLTQVHNHLSSPNRPTCLSSAIPTGKYLTLDRTDKCDGIEWNLGISTDGVSASMEVVVDGRTVECRREFWGDSDSEREFPRYQTHPTSRECLRAFQSMSGERIAAIRSLVFRLRQARDAIYGYNGFSANPEPRLGLTLLSHAGDFCQGR